MFSSRYYSAPAQRRSRQPAYNELDFLADDLEYRASLARQAAARRQPTSPVPRYMPRDAAPATDAYERASPYHRQVSFLRQVSHSRDTETDLNFLKVVLRTTRVHPHRVQALLVRAPQWNRATRVLWT